MGRKKAVGGKREQRKKMRELEEKRKKKRAKAEAKRIKKRQQEKADARAEEARQMQAALQELTKVLVEYHKVKPVVQEKFLTIETASDKLEILRDKHIKYKEFLDPKNWQRVRIVTEPVSKGHRGTRYQKNWDVTARNAKGEEVSFIMKFQRFDPKEAFKYGIASAGEIEAAQAMRVRAGVPFEEPIGYWTVKSGPGKGKYGIFRKVVPRRKGEQVRTILFEEKALEPALEAAKYHGRAYRANMVVYDTGTQHIFTRKDKKTRKFKKGLVFFDAEYFIDKPASFESRIEGFQRFAFDTIAEGNVRSLKDFEKLLSSFLREAGKKPDPQTGRLAQDKQLARAVRRKFSRVFRQDLLKTLWDLKHGTYKYPYRQYSSQRKDSRAVQRIILPDQKTQKLMKDIADRLAKKV